SRRLSLKLKTEPRGAQGTAVADQPPIPTASLARLVCSTKCNALQTTRDASGQENRAARGSRDRGRRPTTKTDREPCPPVLSAGGADVHHRRLAAFDDGNGAGERARKVLRVDNRSFAVHAHAARQRGEVDIRVREGRTDICPIDAAAVTRRHGDQI